MIHKMSTDLEPETDDTSTTPTPPKVTEAATQSQALPDERLVLLGTLLSAKGASALLQKSGRVHKVSEGDRISGHLVAAIEDGMIVLARNGDSQTLRIPGQ